MKRIYLYKTANKSVSYDNEHWYVDDAPQPQKMERGLIILKNMQQLKHMILCLMILQSM